MISAEGRSRIMKGIKKKDTTPEKLVRRLLHKMGCRFRLHRSDLPRTPDITLPGRRAVVLVHGCFWHQHANCPKGRTPTTRPEYWVPKLRRNVERDEEVMTRLRDLGWSVTVVWECELADPQGVRARLAAAIPR